jgi:hypothetical protein
LTISAHPGRISEANQQAFRAEQPGNCLAPSFFARLDQQLVAAALQIGGAGRYVLDIELQPGVRLGRALGPFVLPEASIVKKE